jgi:hypothetical protein
MAAAAPPAYPDQDKWAAQQAQQPSYPAGFAPQYPAPAQAPVAAPLPVPSAPAAGPRNENLTTVRTEMGNLERVCESLGDYIKTQIESVFNGEYPGKEKWGDFVATVREQVSAMESAAKKYALYLNMTEMSELEKEKIKVPTVLLLDLIKTTLVMVETSKVKSTHKAGFLSLGKKSIVEHSLMEDSRISTSVHNIRTQVRVEKLDLNRFQVDIAGQLGGVVRIGGFTERDIYNQAAQGPQ